MDMEFICRGCGLFFARKDELMSHASLTHHDECYAKRVQLPRVSYDSLLALNSIPSIYSLPDGDSFTLLLEALQPDGTFKCSSCDFTCCLIASLRAHYEEEHHAGTTSSVSAPSSESGTFSDGHDCNESGASTSPPPPLVEPKRKAPIVDPTLFRAKPNNRRGIVDFFAEDYIRQRPHACEFCPKRFTKVHMLKNHRRIHTGEKPFKCQQCSAAFKQETHLNYHLMTHDSSNRPFTCNICGRGFARKFSLSMHGLIHDGIFRYQCDYCDRKFRQMGEKHKHERLHTKKNVTAKLQKVK